MQLSVYALFDGQCHSAMSFYQHVFGGELSLIKVKDSPMQPMFPDARNNSISANNYSLSR